MITPLRVLNLGAGIQSTTVYLQSCLGVLPRLDCAIFADTQWEPTAVYRHLDWLEAEIAPKYGIPIYRVTAGNLRNDMVHMRERRARMPLFVLSPDGRRGMLQRQCTTNYKIVPIDRFIKTKLLGLSVASRFPSERVVQQWSGISVDEYRRCRHPVRRVAATVVDGVDLFGEIQTRQVVESRPIRWKSHYYPLCNREFHSDGTTVEVGLPIMTRAACVAWLSDHGFPTPPRSACIGCPFHSDAEWLRMKNLDPAEWEDAVRFDEAIRDYEQINAGGVEYEKLRGKCFLHADRVPLGEVKMNPENDMPMFQCSDGICGV